jgi:hypothetical protein
MINYNGNEIMIEEMPQGCVVHRKPVNKESINIYTGYPIPIATITVASLEDAVALRDSLNKMIKIIDNKKVVL